MAAVVLIGVCTPAWAQTNQPPILGLTQPWNGISLNAPANLTVAAWAYDADGIASIAFYDGDTLLATDTQAPYEYQWVNVPAGNHSLTARATDTRGAVAASAAVTVSVNLPPSVSLTAPTAGATFLAPATLTLSADASDSDGSIASVSFYRDNTLVGIDTSAPYSVTLSDVGAWTYDITARATDNKGAVTTSAPARIVVNALPILGLTQPWEGANFNAPTNFTVAAWAYDADGIASIAFFAGDTLLATVTQAPYEFRWTNAPAGTHVLTARATDTRGAVATSSAMTVTVNGGASNNQPPNLGLSQPWNGATFNAPTNFTVAAWAYDADGIASIAFYAGDTLLATVTQAPYEFRWTNAPAGTHILTARATDTRGAVATSSAMTVTVNGGASNNQPPNLGLTQPWNGATFNAPTNFTVAAWAYDADGIASIAFYAGDTLLATVTQAPYEFRWTNAPAGTHILTARATDTRGAVATSSPMTVTVNGGAANQAPTVSLTGPAAGAQFIAPASVILTANAADSDGSIVSVAFYNGATLLGSATSAPYSFNWSNVAAGSYSITAHATDNQGAVTTSAAATVTVNAPANQAPTVSLTAPAAGASFTAPATLNLTADAADSDGSIASVAFYNGATLLDTDNTAPYSFNWSNVAAGSYSITAHASDNQGAVVVSDALTVVVAEAPPPTLSIVSPAPAQVLPADALPLLQAAFDAPAGIDLSSLKVLLDGQDVTATLGATATGFSHTPAQALVEGLHTLEVTVANTAGVVTTQSVSFKTESTPLIAAETPKDVFLPGGSQPVIFAAYSDVGAGIDPAQVKLTFRGIDVTAQAEVLPDSIRYVVPQTLPDGTHAVRLDIADKAGNRASSEWQFGTAQPPEIGNTEPKDTVLPAGSRPTISASYQDSRNGIDTSKVRLFVNSDDVTAQAQIGATGVSYTPAQPLAEGPYTVYLEVANTSNAATSAVWGFEVDAAKTYNLAITSPAGAQTVSNPTVTVTAKASANRSYPTGLTLGGKDMQVVDADADGAVRYSGQVDLIDGTNTLQVVASFADGQTRNASVEVAYDAPARITLLSPADKAVLGPVSPGSNAPGGATDLTGKVERPVTITGQLSKPVVSVSINQQQATLGDGGRSFSFPKFFLREGTNMITAVATDALGRVVSTAITVSVDQTAPILRLEAPLDQAITSNNRIDIRGMVNDAVEGLIGAAEPTVSVQVNGQSVATGAAQVADRYFVVPDVPLLLGRNTLRITATDHVGNARAQEIAVTRIAVGSDRLTLLSGNRQTAAANTLLPQPLVVVALNPAGEPLRGLPVQFDVMRGTGTISLTADNATNATKADGLSLARNLTVATDDFGRAQVWYTVGKQSGPGANEVRASHPALGEAVTFSANTLRGVPLRVNADHGKNQIGETNAQPLELLSLVVRDALDNPLPNVPVVFTIEEGDAVFPDVSGAQAITYPNGPSPDKAAQRIVMSTDKNGITAVRPLLGNTPGLVRIRAQALKSGDANVGSIDNPADLIGNASFLIQVKQAQDGPAIFSGQIFDDKSQPLAGIKVSIGRTSLVSTTDAQGQFEINNVPPGRIDLFIDGRTYNPTNDPGKPQYPSLHFEAYAVKGQNNQLTQPIYLPPLAVNPESARIVGGDQDVILTIPGLEGFQMKVKANSVTFPDGSRTGLLIVSPVTADKLPMAPPGGGSFGLPAWTVQPAGTRFDPPIEVTMPNNRAYRAGDNQPVVQWDHDLSQYVPMGRATVSEDGSVLVTDSGSGLTKAGWGALCVYDEDKCATTSPPQLGAPKIIVKGWNEGDTVVEPVDKAVTFRVEAVVRNCTPTTTWTIDGQQYTGTSATHRFSQPKKANVSVKIECQAICEAASNPTPVTQQREVFAAKVTVEEAWSAQFDNGNEANGWVQPGGRAGNFNSANDKPYALMGVRNDDAGYVRLKTKIEPNETVVKERVLFGMTNGGALQGSSGACPNASGPVTDDKVCIKVPSPGHQDMYPDWGIDKNKDSKIDAQERGPTGQHTTFKFRMVSNAEYQNALNTFNQGVATGFGEIGVNWLQSFRDGTVPMEGQPISWPLKRNQAGLSHSVGAHFAGGRTNATGPSREVIYAPDSRIVKEIFDNGTLENWIRRQIAAKYSEYEFEVNNPVTSGDITLPAVRTWTFKTGRENGMTFIKGSTGLPDMYAAIGAVLEAETTVRVQLHKKLGVVVAESVVLESGYIKDLFDWDYDLTAVGVDWADVLHPDSPKPIPWFTDWAAMARAAAKLQAAHMGQGSVKPGGMVFLNHYQLGTQRNLAPFTVDIYRVLP